jgi:hypothetical protein
VLRAVNSKSEVQYPKFNIRNSKEARNPNAERNVQLFWKNTGKVLEHASFSDLGIRISSMITAGIMRGSRIFVAKVFAAQV